MPRRWDKKSGERPVVLHVLDVASGQARQVTEAHSGDRGLRWSADGETLYFLGKRRRDDKKKPPHDGSRQVWKVRRTGGELSAVTRVEDGIAAFDLTGDRTLFYSVETKTTDHDKYTAIREKYPGLEYGHGSRQVSQLWKLDLQTGEAKKVLDAGRYVRDFTAMRNGKRVALITAPDDKVITFEGRSTVDVFEVESRTLKTLPDRVWRTDAASPYAWLEHLAWSPDGKRLAFNAIFDAYPAEIVITEWDDKGPQSSLLPRGAYSVRGYGSPLRWRTPSALGWLAKKGTLVCLAECSRDADKGAEDHFSDAVVSGFSCDANGERQVALVGDADHFPDLFLLEGDKKPRKLTNLNSKTATWKLPKVSRVYWQGANGEGVGGVLELPADYREGEKKYR